MSVRVMAAVWEHSPHHGGTLLVHLAIADHSNDEGIAWPSVATIAKKARMSERNVQLALARLEASGALTVDHHQGAHGCNLYRLNSAPPQGFHPPQSFRGEKNSRGGERFDRGGEKNDTQGVKPASPKPSLEPSNKPPIEPSVERGARDGSGAVDDEFKKILTAEYGVRLGGLERVVLAISKATNATGFFKAVDRRKYVRDWLEKDALDYTDRPTSRARTNDRGDSRQTAAASAFADMEPRS